MTTLAYEVERMSGVDESPIFDKQLPSHHFDELEKELEQWSKHRLEYFRKACGVVVEKKYSPHKHRKPLYGNLPRVFTEELVIAFFNEPVLRSNVRVRNKLLKQFLYGRRIGEVNDIRLIPGQNLVQIVNHKSKKIEYKPLIQGTERLFLDDAPLNPHYLRKYFRETCQRLGPEFQFTYDKKGNRRLHQYTTHTLRKTAANMLRVHTGDPYKVAVYIGHDTSTSFGPTSVYMHYDIEEMRKDLNDCFERLVFKLL